MLQGKCVLLGVTGSIAAYKTASLASQLKKLHCDVQVIMTRNATEFITPRTFETLTGNRCHVDMFDAPFEAGVQHIELAHRADLILVAPASANVIAKLAHGLADDMLTTTILASRAPKVIAPAMNTGMYENPATQENIAALQRYGMEVITPASGLLACNDVGIGKMPEPEDLLEFVLKYLACPKDLNGKKVLVTAGPTQEAIDPVRYITNHSTGKMGYMLARACMLRGAEVTLISGQTALKPVPFTKQVDVLSAADMFAAVKAHAPESDMVFMTAAIADYTPKQVAENKIKKGLDGGEEPSIELKRTTDILKYLGQNRTRPGQLLCGFSMETENMLANSAAKLERKNVDMIIANSLRGEGQGFAADTNVITIITKNGHKAYPKKSKYELSHDIIDAALKLLAGESIGEEA